MSSSHSGPDSAALQIIMWFVAKFDFFITEVIEIEKKAHFSQR
jgi:hypothetical protein